MILIEQEKYACLECIRGHRSSKCRHLKKPLLRVRSKGRPNVNEMVNPSHRVAVYAQEIANPDDKDENTVIVTKTSPKQLMDVENGVVLGDYSAFKDRRPTSPMVNSGSFVVMSGNCSSSRKGKGCGCAHNARKKVDKAHILKNFLSKNGLQNWKFINSSPEVDPKLKQDTKEKIEVKQPTDFKEIPSFKHEDNVQRPSSVFESDIQKRDLEASLSFPSVFDEVDASPGCMCPAGQCRCWNCDTHGIIDGVALNDFFNSSLDSTGLAYLLSLTEG